VPGCRLPLLPRQRHEAARRRSAFFRRVPLGRPIARTTSNATRHHVEAWPPLHDFRRILRAHPGVSARPRALDPLITGLASSSMRRSPTSAIGRSASTHLRTPTPDVPIRAARLTPRHVESTTSAPNLHQPNAVTGLVPMAPARPDLLCSGAGRGLRRTLRPPSAMARGESLAPNRFGPDTSCRVSRACNNGDVAAHTEHTASQRRVVGPAPITGGPPPAPVRENERGSLHPRCLRPRRPLREGPRVSERS